MEEEEFIVERMIAEEVKSEEEMRAQVGTTMEAVKGAEEVKAEESKVEEMEADEIKAEEIEAEASFEEFKERAAAAEIKENEIKVEKQLREMEAESIKAREMKSEELKVEIKSEEMPVEEITLEEMIKAVELREQEEIAKREEDAKQKSELPSDLVEDVKNDDGEASVEEEEAKAAKDKIDADLEAIRAMEKLRTSRSEPAAKASPAKSTSQIQDAKSFAKQKTSMPKLHRFTTPTERAGQKSRKFVADSLLFPDGYDSADGRGVGDSDINVEEEEREASSRGSTLWHLNNPDTVRPPKQHQQGQRQQSQRRGEKLTTSTFGGSRSSQRRRRAHARRLMREWTESIETPKLNLDGVLFLLLVVMALIVCPVTSLVKSENFLHPSEFAAPLRFKHALAVFVQAASIVAGAGIIAYALLSSCIRSTFPVLETQAVSYSDFLLNRMHNTVGGQLGYECLAQTQTIKKKYKQM